MQTTHFPFASTAAVLRLSHWFSGLFEGQSAGNPSLEQRVDHIHALQRMARDLEASQPNLAAELRNFVARS
jgi:hypothetical protein